MLAPYIFSWPRNGPPTFLILESPLLHSNVFLSKKIRTYVSGKKRYVAHNVRQSLFEPGFSYLRNSVCLMAVTQMPTEFMV